MTSAQSYQRSYLRGLLATQGILLDEPTDPAPPVEDAAVEPPVDRDEVLRILIAAGAPEVDLPWLVPSCPSLEAARGYRAPPRQSWCIECGDVTACDGNGCLPCRGSR